MRRWMWKYFDIVWIVAVSIRPYRLDQARIVPPCPHRHTCEVLDFIASNISRHADSLRQYSFSLDGKPCANPWLLNGALAEIMEIVVVILIMFVTMVDQKWHSQIWLTLTNKIINCANQARHVLSSWRITSNKEWCRLIRNFMRVRNIFCKLRMVVFHPSEPIWWFHNSWSLYVLVRKRASARWWYFQNLFNFDINFNCAMRVKLDISFCYVVRLNVFCEYTQPVNIPRCLAKEAIATVVTWLWYGTWLYTYIIIFLRALHVLCRWPETMGHCF